MRKFFQAPIMVGAALCLSGCPKQWMNSVVDVNCGSFSLHFFERCETSMEDSFYTQVLTLTDKQGSRVLDAGGPRQGAVYAPQLYTTQDDFHLLAPDRVGISRESYQNNVWDIFVDEKIISDQEFEQVAACLERNIPVIDAAYDRPREDTSEFSTHLARHARITSIIHRAWDNRFRRCNKTTVGRRFDCNGPIYLKTIAPDWIEACRTDTEEYSPNFSDIIARIPKRNEEISIRGPGSGGPANGGDYRDEVFGVKALVGPAWRDLYKTCRDSNGKTIFDYFKIAKDH